LVTCKPLLEKLISGVEADLGGHDQLSTIELALVQALWDYPVGFSDKTLLTAA